MSSEYTHSLQLVSVTIIADEAAGLAEPTIIAQGYGRVGAAFANPQVQPSKSSGDGRIVTRSLTEDQTGTISLELEAASPTNNLLDALADKDRENKKGLCTVQVKHKFGTEVYSGKKCSVRQKPDSEQSPESGTREWVFEAMRLKIKSGGLNQA